MKKVGICGHFGGNQEFLDGQTVKTKTITTELKRYLGESEVLTVDTYGGMKTMIKQLRKLIGLMKDCENIIIFPAHNSLRVFAPTLVLVNKFRHRRLHYVVIGGWLSGFVKKRKWLGKCLEKFDYIYVETSTMKKALEEQGYRNILIMPNCKDLKILDEEELEYSFNEPYKLCIFSRITEKKGIEDAVNTVLKVNKKYDRIVFALDIYGQIDEEYRERFEKLKETFPEYIAHKGVVPFDKSVEVLKEYYALLFPTKFYTEGIPGTIIDAYAAGVPVVSARWESYADVVDDGIVGKGYEFNNLEELTAILMQIAERPDWLTQMKKNCLKKAEEFSAKNVVGNVLGRMLYGE